MKEKSAEPIFNPVPKPIVLIVLDGWGVGDPFAGNAIALANTPNMDNFILHYPSTTLAASGEAVGLPWGEEGNSEVGHLNLGLGRIVYQEMPRINKAITDGSFYQNSVLQEAIRHIKTNNSALHLVGLASNGGVHSSIDHLYALLSFAAMNKLDKVYLHIILDGRDTAYNAGLSFVQSLMGVFKEKGVGEIATIAGRFYAMDRNNNWDRTQKAYLAMVAGAGNRANDPLSAIEKSYKKRIYDEEFVPTVIEKNGQPVALVQEGDAVIFFNFRADRARQLTKAFVLPNFNYFERPFLKNLFFATFTEYEKGLPVKIIFPPEQYINGLGEVLSKNNLRQLRIAETEKYAHVTYFFNGGREEPFEGEDHILIPSPNVSSYDQKPE
ncbi:2,3-bisphosphoglycerate-independent phosphoglycerate mutase, partial [Candidatus Parcubacteria bacterium]